MSESQRNVVSAVLAVLSGALLTTWIYLGFFQQHGTPPSDVEVNLEVFGYIFVAEAAVLVSLGVLAAILAWRWRQAASAWTRTALGLSLIGPGIAFVVLALITVAAFGMSLLD